MSEGKGLQLKATPALFEFLTAAAHNPALSEEVRHKAGALAEEENVSWKRLRPIYVAIREGRNPEGGPLLHEACKGSELILHSPVKKERSPELVARLQELQRREEERKYKEMVHDITASERKAEALRDSSLASYKDQLSYGLHIIVVMAVFYIMGHLAASRISPTASMKAAGGLLGLVAAMLMESVLLIIRTSDIGQKKTENLRKRPVQPFSGTRMPNSNPQQNCMAAVEQQPAQPKVLVEPKKQK